MCRAVRLAYLKSVNVAGIAYGGQYSAAGQHASCPERYIGKAYVNSQEWDISGMAQCEQGVGCPVSETYTDAQFMVPMVKW